MPRDRRTFTTKTKKEIVATWVSGKKTIEQLEKEYDVTRYQIYGWKEKFIAKAVEEGHNPLTSALDQSVRNIPPNIIPIHSHTHNHPEPSPGEINQLKAKMVDLYIEIDRLRTELAKTGQKDPKKLFGDTFSLNGTESFK